MIFVELIKYEFIDLWSWRVARLPTYCRDVFRAKSGASATVAALAAAASQRPALSQLSQDHMKHHGP